MNIDKYRVAKHITEYRFLRIIIPKLVMIRQLFHIKMSKSIMFQIGVWTLES